MKNTYEKKLLSDQQIRDALKAYLNSQKDKPLHVVDELSVHNGNARADVVAFYNYVHCFEIKSDLDSLCRLDRQVTFYDYTFKKNTIVTTKKFIDKVQQVLPKHWGILLAESTSADSVKIKPYRNAQTNKKWEAEKALLTLWKSELQEIDLEFSKKMPPNYLSRKILASSIAETRPCRKIQELFFKKLTNRFLSEPSEINSY